MTRYVRAAGPSYAKGTPKGRVEASRPAALPALWVTHLTCPTCGEPDGLVLFHGVGTVCVECGDATRVLEAP